MKHMAYGKAALLGVFALAGCYSYASEAINNGNYNTVQASPNFVVINVGDSDRVIARLINDNNNGAVTSYAVSGVGAGIRVDSSCTVPDLTTAQQVAASCNGYYRPIFDASKDTLVPTGDKTAQQFFVLGLAVGQYTFTLTPTSVNTGVSRTVTVVVNPITLGPALSKTTGVAGDTIIVTAPSNTVFSQASVVTFANGLLSIVGRSADSTTITFIAGPGISGPATVTLVGNKTNAAIPPVTLVTTNTLTTPQVTVAPTTVSNAAPDIGVPVTVTMGGGLRFLNSSHIFIGGTEAGIVSLSADSATATVLPMAYSAGAITYTNIALSFLTAVSLSEPSDGKSITVSSTYGGPTDANADSPVTASTITLTGSRSTAVADGGVMVAPCVGLAGTFGATATCKYYKFTATAASMSGDLVWDAGTNADLGIYILGASGTTCLAAIADDFGLEPGNVGEHDANASGPFNCAFSANANLVAGASIVAIVNFDHGGGAISPVWYEFRISQP